MSQEALHAIPEWHAPSQILQAIGRNIEEADSGVRFSLGRYSAKEEVITVVKALKKVVDEIRSEVNT